MITNPFHILTIFFAVICVSLLLIEKSKLAAKISPVILILFFSALLANTGLLPTEHAFYPRLSGYAVPFAVCLILLHVRLAEIRKIGWPLLAAFAVASAGSLVGCLVSGVLFQDQLDVLLAGEGWKLAGPYIGTYIGGSVNFNAMWSDLHISNASLFAAANAVDNLTLVPIFIFWLFCPKLLDKWYPKMAVNVSSTPKDAGRIVEEFKVSDIARLILIALAIIWFSDAVKERVLNHWLPEIPAILIVTTLSLIAAQFRSITNLHGAKPLGNLAFYLFFAATGARMDIPAAIGLAPVLFLYVVVIILVQIVFALVIGRLLRMDLRNLAVASLAAKGGPSTVAAYTNTQNWNDLAVPGISAAILGYAIANFVAFFGAKCMQMLVN